MITSTSNPRIQEARRLRRRSGRDDAAAYLVEGVRAVTAALESGGPVREVFLDPDADGADLVAASARGAGVDVTPVAERVVKALSESTTPQGAVAVLAAPRDSFDSMADDVDLVLVLAGVADPGNAGTLVRSAVAAGAGAVVFPSGAVDALNSKTVRATAGHLWSTRIIRDVSLTAAADDLKARGFTLYGLSARGGRRHDEADLRARVALFVGNEAWGLPEEAAAVVDELVAIRMPGPAESLNAAIAGSILLFEAVRQRSAR